MSKARLGRLGWCLSILVGAVGAACGGGSSGDGPLGGGGDDGGGTTVDADDGGGGLNVDASLDTSVSHVLTIEPATATLTINSKTAAAKQPFVAKIDGATTSSTITWTLDSYATGSIDPTGVFTTGGLVGGVVTVNAQVGKLKGTAKLTVNVAISETLKTGATDPGPSAANLGALKGTPTPDPGLALSPPNPTKILYPYDKTVMPRGLTAPLLQFSPGNVPPEDAKVSISAPTFSWDAFIHVGAPGTPQLSIPQDIWDGALETAGGTNLTVSVTKAAKGVAYGPAKTSIIVAPASLRGAVYYMTYFTPGNGLYSVKPGVRAPAKLLIPGCVVCHSVSANGQKLATGADDATFAAQSGVYNVASDGTATQITGAPSGLGGDTRGLSHATFTPDGAYVMRSQNNFWGGPNQLAWKVDATGKKLTPATVKGLGPSISALLPAISGDSKRYAFTNGPGEPTVFGTPSRSISIMDLTVDATTDTLTFDHRTLLLDNGASGSVAKFVNFLPDPDQLILQEGEGYQTSYDSMLPTWDPSSTYKGSTGRLYMLKAKTKEHIELLNLNTGNATIDRQRNYEPFSLPVTAGGYFWVVFTSIREYGNVYQGDAVRKQLWVAAISPTSPTGIDPSHPPFYLPNQSDTPNERGAWALDPCHATGATCTTGDECCDGFCRPKDPADPTSPKVCGPPPASTCSEISEKCTTDDDCCDKGAGARCIGGFCTPKVPS